MHRLVLPSHLNTERACRCEENGPRLRKGKSRLQFQLRVQEFVELVRRDEVPAALAHARTHLVPWAASEMAEVQRVVALLVFRAHTTCARYAGLLEAQQWDALAQLFCTELYRLNCLPRLSALEVHLQAGLTALKSPLSYEEGCCTKEARVCCRARAQALSRAAQQRRLRRTRCRTCASWPRACPGPST